MRLALLLAAATALASCGQPDPVAEEADTSALPVINEAGPSPTGAPPSNANSNSAPAGASTASSQGPATIPAALRGRWGLTPRDCTTALGDAKGLLIVNSDELRFYESRAIPAPGVLTTENSISGDFSFTGEGQEWTSHVTLEVRDGRLVRTQREPVARFRYVRC